ncbi:ABC transporter permease [Leekyejoonella antrihumi]|nr:ABC transporter permease subunit [Leekyejoonella antrihumi]
MFGRRRNQAGLVVLALVPILLAVAVKLSPPSRGGGPTFLDQITENGLFVGFTSLTVELTLFLPLAMAMVSGDTIAGEAHVGTLRYLLTVPVSRPRILAVKYFALVVGAFIAVGTVVVLGAVVGSIIFGTGQMTTLSGTQIGLGAGIGRLAVALVYVALGMCALAAIGLFLSTLTEQPIAVTVALMVIVAAMWIVDAVPQLSFLRPWLLVDKWPAFADLMHDPPRWDQMIQGAWVDGAYIVVFLLAAWARFAGKDITS